MRDAGVLYQDAGMKHDFARGGGGANPAKSESGGSSRGNRSLSMVGKTGKEGGNHLLSIPIALNFSGKTGVPGEGSS